MVQMPASYHERENAASYDQQLYRAGKVLQEAELNDLQISLMARMRGVTDVLFRDGNVIRDCVVIIDPDTGVTSCGSGAVYLAGMVRGIAPAELTIPLDEVLSIGIRLTEVVITELEDATLLDPAQAERNYGQPGAARLRRDIAWAWDGDEGEGTFYPMFTVENGQLIVKEAPPQIDAVSQAIRSYDRDSTGGSYVVSGLGVIALPDDDGDQVYSIASGAARVNGFGLDFQTSRRLTFDPAADLRYVESEPHVSTGIAAQRVNLNLTPAQNITEVTITAEKTETIVKGAFAGSLDQIAQSSVLSIVEVKQGGTTYVQGVDYQLTAGKVDWSLAGGEPGAGTTYTAKFRYIDSVDPTLVDATGCTVTGAIAGTPIMISYNQMLPRVDRICLDPSGSLIWVKGVAASVNPVVPDVPANLLSIATIYQTWTAGRTVSNDGVRVVPMNEIAALNRKFDDVMMLVAQQRLESSATIRESGAVKGVFVDPFLDDSMRDAGTPQTGAIFMGVLTLPIEVAMVACDSRPAASSSSLAFTLSTSFSVQQTARTGSMLVNPYHAFEPLPAEVKLQPAVDRWVDYQTEWASDVTQTATFWQPMADPTMGGRLFNAVFGWTQNQSLSFSTSSVATLGSRSVPMNLRQIEVRFEIKGFGPGETLSSVTFDGIPVTASAI